MNANAATIHGYSPQTGMVLTRLSFRDVLHARERVGHIDKMAELARTLGYPYMIWNGRVYHVEVAAIEDTGLLADDVI